MLKCCRGRGSEGVCGVPEIAREMEWLAMGLVGKKSPEAVGSKGRFRVSSPLFGEWTLLSSWVPQSSQHCCSGRDPEEHGKLLAFRQQKHSAVQTTKVCLW